MQGGDWVVGVVGIFLWSLVFRLYVGPRWCTFRKSPWVATAAVVLNTLMTAGFFLALVDMADLCWRLGPLRGQDKGVLAIAAVSLAVFVLFRDAVQRRYSRLGSPCKD